ncbi:hypothetical protein Q0M94_25390 (plasmid) [Deinococcus radiomollis]|uniref:hypothetical protein n=1 Tax=Deinococcus radiomollis TaxID=468916 RepID=UPI003891DEBE
MTNLPHSTTETVPVKTKPPRINPFDAHITFATPMRAVPGGMELQLDGQGVIVELHPSMVLKVQETPPEEGKMYTVILWLRMQDAEVHKLVLARFYPVKGLKAQKTLPVFRIAARLMDASSKHNLMLLQVEPNATGGLSEAFLVHVWAKTPLLRCLPERHRTVVVGGLYKHSSRRLIATGFNSFPVGPREGTEGLVIPNSGVRIALPEQDVASPDAQAPAPGPETTSAPAQAQTTPEMAEHTDTPGATAEVTSGEQQGVQPPRVHAPKA